METINQIPADESALFGWNLFILITLVFVLNFFISRWLTIILMKEGFITRHPVVDRKKTGEPIFNPMKKSENFQKCILLWFFPVVGASGLFVLLFTQTTIRFVRKVSVKLFLNHI
jgi:hypothetical protein